MKIENSWTADALKNGNNNSLQRKTKEDFAKIVYIL